MGVAGSFESEARNGGADWPPTAANRRERANARRTAATTGDEDGTDGDNRTHATNARATKRAGSSTLQPGTGNAANERRPGDANAWWPKTAEARARRIIGEALREARLSPKKLPLLPANSGIRIGLVRRLRRETTTGLKWIAEALAVGSWKFLSNLLRAEPLNCNQRELNL